MVLALPARPASRLLSGVPGASTAAAALGAIEYASMAIVTLAYPRSRVPAIRDAVARGEPRSGYLVPAVEKRAVKAVTFSTDQVAAPRRAARKTREPVDLIRCSIGRIGEEGVLQRDDADLVALAVGRAGRPDRLAGAAGGHQGHPVGRRAAAVHGRAPGPGRDHP